MTESELIGEPEVHSYFTPAMLADIVDVSIPTIRRWSRRGLIHPVRVFKKLPYFDFQEVAVARQIANLVSEGVSIHTIEKNLGRLTRWMPSQLRPLAQWSWQVDGQRILLRREEGLIEPDGQTRIDFDSLDDAADRGVSSVQMTSVTFPLEQIDKHLSSPSQFLQLAEQMEQSDDAESAIEVYRALHLAFGPTAETCFRLGELLYQIGELQAARERYFSAIELDEQMVEARASLGCVLAELGQVDLAIFAFRGALDIHPDYADVHFHLGRALEESGDSQQARSHFLVEVRLRQQ